MESSCSRPAVRGWFSAIADACRHYVGHPLDDVVVEGAGDDGSSMRLSLQVKRKFVISGAATNTDFRETDEATRKIAVLRRLYNFDVNEETILIGAEQEIAQRKTSQAACVE